MFNDGLINARFPYAPPQRKSRPRTRYTATNPNGPPRRAKTREFDTVIGGVPVANGGQSTRLPHLAYGEGIYLLQCGQRWRREWLSILGRNLNALHLKNRIDPGIELQRENLECENELGAFGRPFKFPLLRSCSPQTRAIRYRCRQGGAAYQSSVISIVHIQNHSESTIDAVRL